MCRKDCDTCFLRCGRGPVPGSSKVFQSSTCLRLCHYLKEKRQLARMQQSPRAGQPLSPGRQQTNHKQQVRAAPWAFSLQSFISNDAFCGSFPPICDWLVCLLSQTVTLHSVRLLPLSSTFQVDFHYIERALYEGICRDGEAKVCLFCWTTLFMQNMSNSVSPQIKGWQKSQMVLSP